MEKGWLFSFFQTFSVEKRENFAFPVSKNAGVGNDPRDRRFNIERQAQVYDGNGKFVRLWLQEQLF